MVSDIEAEHKLRVIENRALRRICGPKRDELTGGWIDEVEEDEVGWACSANGGKMKVYRLLVGKPEGKRRVGGPKRR
jgi:hypothetical protein